MRQAFTNIMSLNLFLQNNDMAKEDKPSIGNRSEVKPEISPCCKVVALLGARFQGFELWKCTKCGEYNKYKIVIISE